MSERNHTAWAVALGAVVGGAVAYLFLTEKGRKLRAQIEPRIGELINELDKWGAVDQLKQFAMFSPAASGGADWEDDPDSSLH
jgi:hypothetical protein